MGNIVNINEDAVLKSRKDIEIKAPVETVWKIQADINSWPDWQPEISDAKMM
ncbi:SRPBCC family protein [Marinimicrobium alkaliphilum]|uniref:SRPBCC family protein n=1 Tax=Marinimicrobium alkaliphilum TaxID=2202654 RepID=UPI000DBA68CB